RAVRDWSGGRLHVVSGTLALPERHCQGRGCVTILRPPRLGRGASPLNADGSLHESPPAAFGPFRVLHQVGAGSLGPVFRAHDPVEGRLVAIKAFRLDEVTPEQAAEFAVELED